MFYTFNQNNSGGEFTRNANVDHYVIIEADNRRSSMDIALNIGIYFDGVNEDIDCACCGDRWYESNDGEDVPSLYSLPLTLTNSSNTKNPREHTVVIHYLDGQVLYTTRHCKNNNVINDLPDLALSNEDESERDY
jgi:hypothetical protein